MVQQVFQNRYRIIRELGRGAMGTVFLAQDLVLNTECALKIIPCSGNEVEFQRFQREVLAARKVVSRFVVKTFECGIADGVFFLVSEFISGGNLRDFLVNNSLSLSRKIDLFMGVAQGLQNLHESGVIHRDIKLSNILYDDIHCIPKIGDLGISTFGDAGITSKGEFIGSATHMAPELWAGEPATEKADIYALGILAYELFTGSLPFSKKELFAVIETHKRGRFPCLSEILGSNFPKALESVVRDCLIREPSLRPTAGQIVFRLSAVMVHEESQHPENSPIAAGNRTRLLFSKGFIRKSTLDETFTKTLEVERGQVWSSISAVALGAMALVVATSGFPALLHVITPIALDKTPFLASLLALVSIGLSLSMAFFFLHRALALCFFLCVLGLGGPILVQSFQVEVLAEEHGAYLLSLESVSKNFFLQTISLFSPVESDSGLNFKFLLFVILVCCLIAFFSRSILASFYAVLGASAVTLLSLLGFHMTSSTVVSATLLLVGFLTIIQVSLSLSKIRTFLKMPGCRSKIV